MSDKHKQKHHKAGGTSVDLEKGTVSYHGHRYAWEVDRQGYRWWERRDGTPINNDEKELRLNELVDRKEGKEEEQESMGGHLLEPASETKSKRRRRKGQRADDLKETGKDSHGRNWYYDGAPNKKGERYYFILGLTQNKETKCVRAEIITSRGKATHLLDKNGMKLLLQQVTKVFIKRHGRKELKRLLTPLVA